jgi:hypothetical protein
MRSRFLLVLIAEIIALLILDCAQLLARGRGGGGRGGGGFSRGGGSFSRGEGSFSRGASNFSGGERSFSRGSNTFSSSSSFSGSGSFSRGGGSSFSGGGNNFSSGGGGRFSGSSNSFSSGGTGSSSRYYSVANDSPLFSDLGGSRPSGGRVPSSPTRVQSGDGRPSMGGSAAQLPSGNRLGRDIGNRPSQIPARNEGGTRTRPANIPSQRPSRSDAGNFLGVASGIGAGAALGGAVANRPSQLPANRFGGGQRPAPPHQRPNWSARSLNRDYKWRDQRQVRREDFQKNRDKRWDDLQSRREDGQNFRDQRRQDWQQYRKDLWDYRADRAEEIWDNARDFYDDVFDDAWWGYWGWGTWWPGYYPSDPWWWWNSATWNSLASFVSVPADPAYVDYGVNVVFEEDTVYVDNQPVAAEQYEKPILDAATSVKQPPPPLPPSDPNQQSEWMPLGVFALAQEDRGDPVMFFQLSINRQGIISGAFQSTITNDTRPVAGQVNKASQRPAWRIGDNSETIFETTLGNLTQEVSPIAVHFGNSRTQTWLLVRMPEPAPAGQPQKLPEAPKSPPPLESPKT